MVSLVAIFLILISTITCAIGICFIIMIISYIKHKPEANQSTFDIAAIHLGWSHIFLGVFAYIILCCSMILPDAPNFLILIFEIIIYVGFSYVSSSWIVVNMVAYVFIMHFEHISAVTDSEMKFFCFCTSIVSTIIQITLDRLFPQNNSATYYLFRGKKDMER